MSNEIEKKQNETQPKSWIKKALPFILIIVLLAATIALHANPATSHYRVAGRAGHRAQHHQHESAYPHNHYSEYNSENNHHTYVHPHSAAEFPHLSQQPDLLLSEETTTN